jgi:hypothetical protein
MAQTEEKNAFPGQGDDTRPSAAGGGGSLRTPTCTAASTPITYAEQIVALLIEVQQLRVGVPDAAKELLKLVDLAVMQALIDKDETPMITVAH